MLRMLRWLVLGCLVLCATGPALAQTPFFQGKTIRFVVGYQSGDSHDLWARAYARHMGKHIPGNPTFVVQNMTGAGSMIAANHIYNIAKPDGLTMGTFAPGLYLAQLTGSKEVKFDWAKFSWIGSPEQDGNVLFMRADAPYKTIEDIRKANEPPKCSATGVGTSGHLIPRLLEETLNLKFRLVTGYAGGAEQDLALERGEVHCRAITIAAYFSREPFVSWYKKGFVRFLIQTSRKRHPKSAGVADALRVYGEGEGAGGKSSLGDRHAGRWRIWLLAGGGHAGDSAGALENAPRSLCEDAPRAGFARGS